MGVEEQFNISIPDSEANTFETVDDIYQCVLSKFRPGEHKWCRSSAEFYRLRRVLMDEFNIQRSAITPDTRLDALFPIETRFKDWEALKWKFSNRISKLKYPAPVEAMNIANGVLFFVALCRAVGSPSLVWIYLAGITAVWCLLKPNPRRFYKPDLTIRDEITRLVNGESCWPSRYTSDDGDGRVWTDLQKVMVERLREQPERITREARLVNDLKMG